MHRINGPTDQELLAVEDRAAAAMVTALQQVMDTIAARVGRVQVASARTRWTGCRYCLNAPHTGPCR